MQKISARFIPGWLPPHPYPEQFSTGLDFPHVDWPKRLFLIASTPRCGSHFLGHMLGETGECGVPLEYLNVRALAHWERRFNVTGIQEVFAKLAQHRTSPNGTFTLKAHWSQFQVHADTIDSLTRGLGIDKVIWITRRDLLSQSISKAIAHQTDDWISSDSSQSTAKAKYDYAQIVLSAEQIRSSSLHWREFISSLSPGRSMSVVYEDLLSETTVRDQIATFLDLQTELKPSNRTRKQAGKRNRAWKERFLADVSDRDRWILDPPDWLSPQI